MIVQRGLGSPHTIPVRAAEILARSSAVKTRPVAAADRFARVSSSVGEPQALWGQLFTYICIYMYQLSKRGLGLPLTDLSFELSC